MNLPPHNSRSGPETPSPRPDHEGPDSRPYRGNLRPLLTADFSELVTLRLLQTGYRIVVGLTALTVLFWFTFGLYIPDWMGWGVQVFVLIGAPLTGLMFLAFARMFFEYLIVIFTLNDKVHDIDRKLNYLAQTTYERQEHKEK